MIHETYRNDEDYYILVFIVYRDTSERRMNEKYSFARTTLHSRSWYIYAIVLSRTLTSAILRLSYTERSETGNPFNCRREGYRRRSSVVFHGTKENSSS